MDQILFKQHPSPMLIYDLDTLQILRVNSAFSEKYGFTAKEIERKDLTVKDIRPKHAIPEFMQAIQKVKTKGITDSGVHRHMSKNGEMFYVKVTSQKFPYKGHNSRLAVCHDITDQVKAEKKSAKAFEELQHHIKNSPLASIKWDRKLRVIEWSKQAEELSGYDEEEVLGKSLFSLGIFVDDETDQIKNRIQALVKGELRRDQFETAISHKKGGNIYIRIYSSALWGKSDELQSVLMFVEDITEQKRSEIKYQRLFENANDSIFILSDNRFVDCNKQAEKLFKVSRDEIIGKLPSYFSPDKQPDGNPSEEEAKKRITKALQEGSNMFEWQHKDAEGRLIDVEVSLNKVKFPEDEYVQAIVRDITDKKRTQVKLRKNEELFRNLFLKSPAALVMVDAEDRVQVVNESFENMFGYKLSNIRGENIDDLIVPPGEIDDAPRMKDKSYAENDFQMEGVRFTESGAKKHVIIAGMPVYVDDEPVAGLGMYIDISERKKSERKLKESLKEKQVLLEEVHHRVKNNLAVISGLLQMQTMHVDDERLTKYIQNSQLRIKSMAIVHEMLYKSSTLSEIEFNKYVEKLTGAISDVLAPRAKNITLTVVADDFVLNINQAIPCALILSELITNAYEFAFEGRKQGKVVIKSTKNKEMIDIEVCDDGIGLPDDFEEKRKKSLGINLMENLCQQLETDIEVESGNWGTRFYFTFEKCEVSGSSSTNRIIKNRML